MTDASKSAQTGQQSSYDAAKTKVTHALEVTRDTASRAAHDLPSNPLGVIVGGLALGVVAGALVPRSAREKDLLKPVGKRLASAAVVAVAAAREAGLAELDQRGLTPDAARGQAKSLFEGFGQALSSAGTAAAQKATEQATAKSPTGSDA